MIITDFDTKTLKELQNELEAVKDKYNITFNRYGDIAPKEPEVFTIEKDGFILKQAEASNADYYQVLYNEKIIFYIKYFSKEWVVWGFNEFLKNTEFVNEVKNRLNINSDDYEKYRNELKKIIQAMMDAIEKLYRAVESRLYIKQDIAYYKQSIKELQKEISDNKEKLARLKLLKKLG